MLVFAVIQALVQLTTRKVQARSHSAAKVSSEAVRIRGTRFTFQGRRLPRLLFLWNPRVRHAVVEHIRKLASGPRQKQLADCYANRSRGELLLGLANDKAIALDLSRSPHTLIVGPTGSGKSALLSRLLAQLSSDAVEVWFFDYKSGETIAENLELCGRFTCADNLDGDAIKRQWHSLLSRTKELPATKDLRLVVVVEELAAALLDRDASETITMLAAQGRSVGLRMIATNQTSSGIPRQLLVNLGNRVVMAAADNSERILLGGFGGAPATGSQSFKGATATQGSGASATKPGVFGAHLTSAAIDFEFLAVWSNWGS